MKNTGASLMAVECPAEFVVDQCPDVMTSEYVRNSAASANPFRSRSFQSSQNLMYSNMRLAKSSVSGQSAGSKMPNQVPSLWNTSRMRPTRMRSYQRFRSTDSPIAKEV